MAEPNPKKEKRKKSQGRRATDSHVCMFHVEDKKRTEACLAHIKKIIRENEAEMDSTSKRICSRIDSTISYKAAAIVTTVAVALLVGFMGMAKFQLSDVHEEVKSVLISTESLRGKVDAVLVEGVRVATIQVNVVATIGKINARQEAFARDLEAIKYRLRTMTEVSIKADE